MKQRLLILCCFLVLSGSGFAQFGNLLEKAKGKVKQRADTKVDNAMDKGLDEIEKGPKKSKGTDAGTTKTDESNGSGNSVAATSKPIVNYSKFDFVPGAKVLYAEDFAQDAIGELPLGWNTNNRGEVVTLEGQEGKWLRMIGNSRYLTANKDTFSRNFTIEFDLIYQVEPNGYALPDVKFGFLSTNKKPTTDNSILKEPAQYQQCEIALGIHPPGKKKYGEEYIAVLTSYKDQTQFFKSEIKSVDNLGAFAGAVSHVAVQVQGTRLRCWINGFKVYDLPMALPMAYAYNQLFFELQRSNYKDDELGYYISNIKLAAGLPDTRHKLLDEGKFSTTGILFDVQSAVIKPESAGVLKEIGSVLKENAGVKVKIVGHTSSDGDDKSNLELSRKRAESVKTYLVEKLGIDAARLSTEGKGETQPVGDNKTAEGKTQNRRVEFIKL